MLLLNQSPQSALQAVVYEHYPHSDRLRKKGNIAFSYDPNGNLIEKETPDGRWNYQSDYAHRLIAVYRDGLLIKRYLYDHAGLRIGAVDAEGQTTIYLYDLQGNLIQERKGGEIRNHIWALGKHLARVDGTIGDPASQVYWYHTDHLGTVQVISDAQGQVVWRNDYRAFGEQLGPEVEEIENAHVFTGKDWDEEVGLYYFNARWYEPELGRFVEEDLFIGNPNDHRILNYLIYCFNNPLIYIDPTGLFTEGGDVFIDRDNNPLRIDDKVKAGTWGTVDKGDTLWDIAKQKYGDGSLWVYIKEANRIKDQTSIKPGQTLYIPNLVEIKIERDNFKTYVPIDQKFFKTATKNCQSKNITVSLPDLLARAPAINASNKRITGASMEFEWDASWKSGVSARFNSTKVEILDIIIIEAMGTKIGLEYSFPGFSSKTYDDAEFSRIGISAGGEIFILKGTLEIPIGPVKITIGTGVGAAASFEFGYSPGQKSVLGGSWGLGITVSGSIGPNFD